MKFKSMIFGVIVSQFAYSAEVKEPRKSAKEKLEAISDSDRAAAQELLSAMKSGQKERVREKANDLVQKNKSNLVAISLFDSSNWVKTEAAKALISVKKKSIAQALVDASEVLDCAVIGGTESMYLLEQARAEFARTLTAITGVEVNKDWTYAERVNALKDAIAKLPE